MVQEPKISPALFSPSMRVVRLNILHFFMKLFKYMYFKPMKIRTGFRDLESVFVMLVLFTGVRLFARRTFTTPKIRTFTTPKFGHFPPPKKTFARRTTATPNFFFFFGALFLAFSTYSSGKTSRMGRRRCLTRWSWSTSSRGCVTRWSWSTSSRRCLTSWSWSTSSRGRRWKRSPRW